MNEWIDEVAREMTSGPAPDSAAFRRSVMARIDANDGRRSTFGVRRSAFALTPVAVAAAIVIAIFIARQRTAPPVLPKPDTTAAAAAAPAVAAPVDDAPDRTVAARTAALRTRRTSPIVAQPAALDSDVASIAVAPLTVAPINPDPIQLDRLDAVTPITVAPLDITDSSRRNQ